MPALIKSEPKVIWAPIPGTSQEFALDTRCQITLFHGTRGPGKTDTQLMRFRRRVGIGYGPFWRGVIFDRRYKNLDDLVSKSKRWFHKFDDGAEWLQATHQYKWVWPTGEELLFRRIEKSDDYYDYHGQEFPFIGWNELTKYPVPDLFDKMMSCNRSSFTVAKDSPHDPKTGKQVMMEPIPLEVFATTNSYGPGHSWVKERFIDAAPNGKVLRTTIRVFNPQTQQEEDVVRTQVAIFGSYKENIYLDPLYIANLHQMCENDENLRKSWLEGSWDVIAGGAFSDVWKREIHVIPRFQIPSEWHLDRTFDWGSSAPFSIGLWAEANGEEVTLPDGRKFCPKPGSLIRFAEWYGGKKEDSKWVGLRKSSTWIAIRLKQLEDQLLIDEWILTRPFPGPADNQIRDVREDDVETIEDKMKHQGVYWEHSDKSPGSRKIGVELMRDRLTAAVKQEGPAIYFMDNCFHAIRTIAILPRDEDNLDDVDTEAEDHPWDDTRYRVLKSSKKLPKKLPVKMVN